MKYAQIAALASLLAVLIASPITIPITMAKAREVASNGNDDPFLWLEQVRGKRALAWVEAQDAKTVAVLQNDPRYHSFYNETLKIYQSKERIPYPMTIGGELYNFWQDKDHVRGIWRRTSTTNYATSAPTWTTVLDLDALTKAEHANWVWQGVACVLPEQRRCFVFLSDGGEDAQTIREFDVTTRRFVPNGFALPRSKQNIASEDVNTLLVARPWKPGEVTTSGYAYDVRRLKRGQPLASATEVFRGSPSDVDVTPLVLRDGVGHQLTLIERDVSFFNSQYYLLGKNGARQLHMPERVTIGGLVGGRLVFSINQNWTVADRTLPEGSLLAFDFPAIEADPEHLTPALIYTPGPREALDQVVPTKSRLLVVSYLNVRGRASVFRPVTGDRWTKHELELPENASLVVDDTNLRTDTAYIESTGFLAPTTLYDLDAASGSIFPLKSRTAQFDASGDVVEQREAVSKDGTKIPYFVVHPKSMPLDGLNPTVLTAYGGFQLSNPPYYAPEVGKLWLERGGVFVLANIRGGGEFGPAWHEAGLTTHRQRVYDDFYAVAGDLIARKVTSPRHLGIQGASNGGLLMGVEFTQHPQMWNAVDMGIPLLDMLRYEKIEAGASWVGEYGSVSNPVQRAFLASISPYQNLKPGVAYPEPFIWTTTKDDRVGPEHARKFAAKLGSMGVPYLFYEVVEGGHGEGANIAEQAHTTSLEWTYFTERLVGDQSRPR